jgi:hypothetical protein
MKRKAFWETSWLLGIGVAIFSIAVVNVVLNALFLHDTVTARGTVVFVEHVGARAENDSDHYFTTVEFTALDGQLVRFRRDFKDVHQGDTVRVNYYADNPQKARIYDGYQFWGWWTIVASFGGGALILWSKAYRDAAENISP